MSEQKPSFFSTIKDCVQCRNFAFAYFTPQFGSLLDSGEYRRYGEHLAREHGVKPWEGAISV